MHKGEIFMNCKILNVVKEDVTGRNYSSTITRYEEFILCKETEDKSVYLPHVGQAVYKHFIRGFCCCPNHKNVGQKAVDLPVYWEANGETSS